MLEDYVSARITRKRLNSGPAAIHIDDFSDWLHARGHTKRSLLRMLQSFAGWTDWLRKSGRAAEDFAEGLQECTKHFTSTPHTPYERGSRRESLSVARLFLRFLAERGLLPQTAGADSRACSAPQLQEFYSWMLEKRGVTRVTLDVYGRVLEEFIATVGGDAEYTYSDVERAIQREIVNRNYLARYELRLVEKQQATDLALLRQLESKYRTHAEERGREPQLAVQPGDQTPVTPIQGSLF